MWHGIILCWPEIWKVYYLHLMRSPQHNVATLASSPGPSSVDDQLKLLERFVVLLYDRTSTVERPSQKDTLLCPKCALVVQILHSIKARISFPCNGYCTAWDESEWGTKASVFSEMQDNEWPSTYSSSIFRAHKGIRSCLSGHAVMSGHRCSQSVNSWWMGEQMEAEK